jgi:hypothetical protein
MNSGSKEKDKQCLERESDNCFGLTSLRRKPNENKGKKIMKFRI